MLKDKWWMNNEWLIMNVDQWTKIDDSEQWTMNNEQGSMINEQ